MTVTRVYSVGSQNKKVRYFKIMNKPCCLQISSFEDGIANILPIPNFTIAEVADIISGCFDKSSNFKFALEQSYGYDKISEFRGINFNFNDVDILVTKENAETNAICQTYLIGLEEKIKTHSESFKYAKKIGSTKLKTLSMLSKFQKEMLSFDNEKELELENT